MSNTMTFKMGRNGKLRMVENGKVKKFESKQSKSSTAYIVDIPRIKESIKNMEFTKGKTMSVALPLVVGTATGVGGAGVGVFYNTFMVYLFPYMLDIAKVYCIIKIAQGFYEERIGGKQGGSGLGNFVTYGKWLLLFHLIPFFILLVDQLGLKMMNDLQVNPITTKQ